MVVKRALDNESLAAELTDEGLLAVLRVEDQVVLLQSLGAREHLAADLTRSSFLPSFAESLTVHASAGDEGVPS